MTVRTFVYGRLMTVPSVNERVYAKKSMTSSIEDTPYIVYKLGYSAPEGLSEDTDPSRQFLQVFIHDFSNGEVADYTRIDEVIGEVKNALRLSQSAEDEVMTIRYLETSQDLNDETLNTVMKYVRFQVITEDRSWQE